MILDMVRQRLRVRVHAAAWRAVVLKYNLLTIDAKTAPFVDPLALLAEQRKRQALRDRNKSKRDALGATRMLTRGVSSSSNAAGSTPTARKKGGAARKATLVKSTKDTYVYELVETAVASTFLFRSMPLDRLKEIVSYMQRFEFEAGQTVMTQVRLERTPQRHAATGHSARIPPCDTGHARC